MSYNVIRFVFKVLKVMCATVITLVHRGSIVSVGVRVWCGRSRDWQRSAEARRSEGNDRQFF
jgi:hypothetical protein